MNLLYFITLLTWAITQILGLVLSQFGNFKQQTLITLSSYLYSTAAAWKLKVREERFGADVLKVG